MLPSTLPKDSNGAVVQNFTAGGTPQTLTVNASGGSATLSAAVNTSFVRLTCTQPTFYICTVAGAVTAGTGHYLAANIPYIIQMDGNTTKISVLGATASAGVCYLSELASF